MEAELLQQIDDAIRGFPQVKNRFTHKRINTLKKFGRNLRDYKENLIDMITTMQSMEKAIKKEVDTIARSL